MTLNPKFDKIKRVLEGAFLDAEYKVNSKTLLLLTSTIWDFLDKDMDLEDKRFKLELDIFVKGYIIAKLLDGQD